MQEVSWQNVLDSIWLFLGLCHKWMGVQQPTLQHFLFLELIGAFVSFHKAKKHSALTIKHHLQNSYQGVVMVEDQSRWP